jgi:hypothetical protein
MNVGEYREKYLLYPKYLFGLEIYSYLVLFYENLSKLAVKQSGGAKAKAILTGDYGPPATTCIPSPRGQQARRSLVPLTSDFYVEPATIRIS